MDYDHLCGQNATSTTGQDAVLGSILGHHIHISVCPTQRIGMYADRAVIVHNILQQML